jgi:DNA-directed RNA polymerase beta subunit
MEKVFILLKLIKTSKLGVGSKLCSLFGNKGVIGNVMDLSHIHAIGNKNFQPDILAPICSTIGRQCVGQILEILVMLQSLPLFHTKANN